MFVSDCLKIFFNILGPWVQCEEFCLCSTDGQRQCIESYDVKKYCVDNNLSNNYEVKKYVALIFKYFFVGD